MSNVEDQNDEICVLRSIYTDEELQVEDSISNEISGQFLAFVSVPTDFKLKYKLLELEGNRDELPTQSLSVAHLPPIVLDFKLPPTYPENDMPFYQLSCPWLTFSKLKILSKKLDELWKENNGTVILYNWTQFLKEESMSTLEIVSNLDLTGFYVNELKKKGSKSLKTESPNQSPDVAKLKKITPDKTITINNESNKIKITRCQLNMHLHQYLLAYNEDRAKTEFLRGLYTCAICFTEKSGLNCILFKPCDHVFCRDCIKSYFDVRIKDNSVQAMPCPYLKCTSEASQTQIREIVGPNMYAKYDKQLLTATLDKMQDVTYCPRTACGYPVVSENDEKMAACPSCSYVFCLFCKMTYHGVEPCRLKNEEKMKLVNEYEDGDANTKLRLEKKYGKKQIQLLVQNSKSESWISSNSKHCPKCNIAIEKIDGCNKITCWKCNAYFCWLCLSVLNHNLPYYHFLDRNSKCYSQLFEGVINEDEDNQPLDQDVEDEYDEEENGIFEEEYDDEEFHFVVADPDF